MNDFFNRKRSPIQEVRDLLRVTLRSLRDELDDNRESINDNTCEIQANYEYVSRVDEKLDKINDRLSQIEDWMSRISGVHISETNPVHIELNDTEKKLFLILYTYSEGELVSYEKISQEMHIQEFLVREHITNMLEKAIPIRKRHLNGKIYLSLDHDFKEKQAKQNILGISQKTVVEFLG